MDELELQVDDQITVHSSKTPVNVLAAVVHVCFDGLLLRDLTVFPGDRHLFWAERGYDIYEVDTAVDTSVVADVYLG